MTRINANIANLDMRVAAAVRKLESLVDLVNGPGEQTSEFAQTLDVLNTLSQKEAIPIAIIGGMAAIRHGYERLTNDLDVVIGRPHLDTVIRVAPKYGIKIIWQDPHGWHKLEYQGTRIEVVPEGGQPSKDAPTTIPGPKDLGVADGLGYANLEGWVQTKLGAGRRQDQADVVQVLKKTAPEAMHRLREKLIEVHPLYGRLFDELARTADNEKQQEAERGGPR